MKSLKIEKINQIDYFEDFINPPYIFLYNHFSQNEVQLIQFILSIFFGLAMGAVADLIRAFRRNFKCIFIVRVFLFLILLICYIICLRMFCFLFAGSAFRIFFIIGNFIGFILWEFTVGYYFLSLLDMFMKFVKKIICIFASIKVKFVRNAKNRKKRKNK